MYTSQRFFLPYLQYVATLGYLVNVENSKNVTEFDSILNKLLTCSRGPFEDDLTFYSS